MASYSLAPNVKRQFLDNSGNPLALGLLYTVTAGGSYPVDAATTYQTSSGTAHSNPIVLDVAGRIPGSSEIYLQPGLSFKFILQTSAGVAVWTQDNIAAVPLSNVNVDIQGTAGEALPAGSVVYMARGTESGSPTPGSWYLTDADEWAKSEGAITVAMTPLAIASMTTGTIRLEGDMEGLGPLTPGAPYYVSSVTGALTATAPSNVRLVGQAKTSSVLTMVPNPLPTAVTPAAPNGRLTLTTAVPVTITDVTAATSVFFAPYLGNRISLYNGTQWHERTFAQLTIAVPATTASIYDVFAYDNAGVVTLELSAAWSSATAIFGAGIYASVRPTQDGLAVKSGNGTTVDATRLYLGSFRTTAVSGQTEDSGANRLLFNQYNFVDRPLAQADTTANWTYEVATWRQQRATATNQVSVLVGVIGRPLTLTIRGNVSNSTGGNVVGTIAIGEDSTTTPVSAQAVGMAALLAAGQIMTPTATLTKAPAIGYHFYTFLEASTAVATTTWQGASSSTAAAQTATGVGMYGSIPA